MRPTAGLALSLAVALLAGGCVNTDKPSNTPKETMRPANRDVIEAYNWLIATIDGTMKATGRTKWLYERGFRGRPCPEQDGHEMFQFSWMASAPGSEDPERSARAAAAYLSEHGAPGIEAGPFRGLWAATYKDDATGIYAQYGEEKGAVVDVSTRCYPGNFTEAEQIVDDFQGNGKLQIPKFFDSNS